MARTQITLDTEMQKRARQRASDLGFSLAEYVRRLIERDIEQPKPNGDISMIFDLFDSGGSNIARDKDKMIGEAWDALNPRKPRRKRRRP